MKKLIHLDNHEFNDDVSLYDLLEDIGDVGNNYIWSFLELEIVGSLGNGILNHDFEAIIAKEPSGYCLSWNDLKDLVKNFFQVINTTIVASENKAYIAQHKHDWDNVFKNFPFVIAMLDGYCWEVSTSDEKIIERLKSKYKILKICDAQERKY